MVKINQDYEIDLQYFLSKGKNQFDNRFANFSPSFHGNYRNEIKLETYAANIKGQINKIWQSSIKLSQSTDKYLDLQKYNKDTYLDEDGVTDLYKTTQDQLSWQNNIALQKGSFNFIYDFLKQKIKNIKYVIRLHGGHHFFAEAENRGINKWKGFQEKRSFKKADAFIAVSNYVKNHTATYLSYYNKN